MFQALFIVCARVIRCQSINHMVHGEICELKNRTKEAKPEYFTDDHTKVYMKKFRKKFLVGYFMKAVPFHFHVCVNSYPLQLRLVQNLLSLATK